MKSADIKAHAKSLGFDLVGVASIDPTPESIFFEQWLAEGYGGKMAYLERQCTARLDSRTLLSDAHSVIVCAVNYNTELPYTKVDRLRAWISRYAWGDDYHEVIKRKLQTLASWIETNSPGHTRAYVDSGPVTERVFAKYAGVGWFGKNTCIINQQSGSWLFLGCILTDLDLNIDTPVPDRCGSCTRCLDACPTDAFIAPKPQESVLVQARTLQSLQPRYRSGDRSQSTTDRL